MVKGDNARLLSVNSHWPIVLGAPVGKLQNEGALTRRVKNRIIHNVFSLGERIFYSERSAVW